MMDMIDPVAVRRRDFLEAMSRGACMVNILTTDGPGGRKGMTLSAMASVSADSASPTLVVCVNNASATAVAIEANGSFCLNLLAEAQHEVADCFAGRIASPGDDKFDCASWHETGTGSWRLDGAVASFDCRVAKSELVGTHLVIIGAVDSVTIGAAGRPLIYSNRAYCGAADLTVAA